MDAGAVVGERYQLVSRLGEGGYGEVWKGFDQVTLLCALLPEMIAVLGADDPETQQAQALLENLKRLDSTDLDLL
ncbi:hypothetical protein ACFHYQ_28395 [Sphaerimonospora cavernae]|uniref:Protein kinase domain-containing protein n=1 Tax=Sphaerimonospora cavernae TaxID=1740611 RepID=A0ABV6UDJ5_9ACTN